MFIRRSVRIPSVYRCGVHIPSVNACRNIGLKRWGAMDKQQEFALRTVEERDVSLHSPVVHGCIGNIEIGGHRACRAGGRIEEGIGFDGSAIEGMTRVSEDDMIVKPDPSTFQILPWRGGPQGTARMFCDVLTPEGEPSLSDPRHVLKRSLSKAKEKGFTFYVHPEIEFYLFEKQDDWSKSPVRSIRAAISTMCHAVQAWISAAPPSTCSSRWASRSNTRITRRAPARMRSP